MPSYIEVYNIVLRLVLKHEDFRGTSAAPPCEPKLQRYRLYSARSLSWFGILEDTRSKLQQFGKTRQQNAFLARRLPFIGTGMYTILLLTNLLFVYYVYCILLLSLIR